MLWLPHDYAKEVKERPRIQSLKEEIIQINTTEEQRKQRILDKTECSLFVTSSLLNFMTVSAGVKGAPCRSCNICIYRYL